MAKLSDCWTAKTKADDNIFSGLELDELLVAKDAEPRCGILNGLSPNYMMCGNSGTKADLGFGIIQKLLHLSKFFLSLLLLNLCLLNLHHLS